MCGIIGAVNHRYQGNYQHVNQDLYNGLVLLQHRGQDAAGMVTSDGQQLFLRKSGGLVQSVFRKKHMLHLQGFMGIGHVRYPTAGSFSQAEAQPFYVNSPYGIVLAHNGTLINADELKRELWDTDCRHINTSSDSEVILNVFAHELEKCAPKMLTEAAIFNAVRAVHQRCVGAYSVVAMIVGYGVVGFRDPKGIRPICYGKRETATGIDYMLASESVALHSLGYKLIADVDAGEAVIIKESGELFQEQCANDAQLTPCIFEQVYLARPDSLIDNILVYKLRLKLGVFLAEKILREWPNHDIDVVMPVPDTSRTAAHSLSLHLGVKYREGLVKNRYIARTFIMPGQQVRKKSVRQKLNAIDLEFQGKNVLLVDDSIVRGTTCREIIKMARDAGAKKVYFASAAPEVRYPNVYGIDMPVAEELIAHNRDLQQICQAIGADRLIFQDLKDLVAAAQEGNESISRFEDSVFTGDYVTGAVDERYLAALAARRSDTARAVLGGDDSHAPVDLYNDE